MMRKTLLCIFLFLSTVLYACEEDSTRHVGYTVYVFPQWQIAMDEYEQKWLHGKNASAFGAELNYTALPSDSDAFAMDYHYPTLSLGVKMALNHGVTMHRSPDPSWGKAQMVDYDSHLGDLFTLYGSFARPLLRKGRWQIDYVLRAGFGYGPFTYNKTNNIDNELIGSAFNIYFGAGVAASYQLAKDWALTAGLMYGHHSNGALARPNKGENHWGPVMGVRYQTATLPSHILNKPTSFPKYWYADFRLGVGGKTLLEDWQRTQFYTDPDQPDYRTERFHFYMAYSGQASLMYRYARRWASGIGADLCYGSYYKHVQDLDEVAGHNEKHSPWSVGIAARHEVYYHRLSLDMTLGIYLYRHMGYSAKQVEQPYYERIGVFYSFPKLANMKIGASVQAHRTKADLTELIVSLPFRISAFGK